MFYIKTKEKTIETTADAALSLTFSNPAFDTQERAFSLPFTAVGEVTDNDVAELYLDGLPVMTGNVSVLKSKRKVRECSFKNSSTRLYDVLTELKCNEILPIIDLMLGVSTAAFEGIILQPSASADFFSISIKGTVFEKDYVIPPTSAVIVADMVALINAIYPDFAKPITAIISQIQFNNIGEYASFDIDWDIFSGFTVVSEQYPADFQEESIRAALTTEPDDFVLPTFQNIFIYDLKNGEFQEYINDNRDGSIPANGWHPTMVCEHTFCPQVRFLYILEKALAVYETRTGESITVLTDAPHAQTISELTLFNLVTIDNFIKEEQRTGGGIYKNAYQRLVNLNNHVPDMTVLELINAVCEIFQLYPTLDNGIFSFRSRGDQFDTEVTDLSNSIDNRVEVEFKTAKGYTLAFADDDQEPLADYSDLVVNGTTIIETVAGTVAFGVTFAPMMISHKKGTSNQLSVSSTTTLRLFFYKGFQEFEAITYPFGTPLNALPDGTINGVTSIRWEGVQGLYAQAWQNVIETATNAPTIKITAWLTALEIINLKSWKMPQIQFYTEGGYRKGIIKQIQSRIRLRPQTRYECELEILEL
jgi:hypothetical protein